jgi:hypothetical protein
MFHVELAAFKTFPRKRQADQGQPTALAGFALYGLRSLLVVWVVKEHGRLDVEAVLFRQFIEGRIFHSKL